MEPNTFDQKIKDIFSTRKIEPSKKAWDRLDAMLTVQAQPQKNPWIFYFTIAASVILIAIVLFFNESSEFENQNFTPSTNPVVIQKDAAKETPLILELKSNHISRTDMIKTNNIFSNPSESHHIILEPSQTKDSLREVLEIRHIDSQHHKRALLLLASLEHDTNQDYLKSTQNSNAKKIVVDATTLLEITQEEMNQTYREKMVKKVSKNLNSIKDTWVNRNLE